MPALQRFENHWASEFLMKESYQNHRTHTGSKQHIADVSDDDRSSTNPAPQLTSAKHASAERKAKDDCGNDDIEDKNSSAPGSNATNASGPYNDGETEIDEVSNGKEGKGDASKDVEASGGGMLAVQQRSTLLMYILFRQRQGPSQTPRQESPRSPCAY